MPATARWSGVAAAKVTNWCTLRSASVRGGGASAQPTRQPVALNVFEAVETVIVRSRQRGSLASGTCLAAPKVMCSYASSERM